MGVLGVAVETAGVVQAGVVVLAGVVVVVVGVEAGSNTRAGTAVTVWRKFVVVGGGGGPFSFLSSFFLPSFLRDTGAAGVDRVFEAWPLLCEAGVALLLLLPF